MKNARGKSAGRCFLKPFFRIRENFFQSFHTKFLSLPSLHEIIGVQNFSLSFCKSKSRMTMCNLHWCYTWTALLSANPNRVIFPCLLLTKLPLFVCIGPEKPRWGVANYVYTYTHQEKSSTCKLWQMWNLLARHFFLQSLLLHILLF